jgi:hypothetical protein
MERIGDGEGVMALLNGRARKVSPKVARALEKRLPAAEVLVSHDLEQARRHAARIAATRPRLVLCGGGDGTLSVLLNLLRDAGVSPFPVIGPLKLGTGNGWANTVEAGSFARHVAELPRLPRRLPTLPFSLVEVEGRLCQFAGIGWDARILNDYLRNLDRRSSQLFGSRLATRVNRGLGGYLYAISRLTIPEESRLLARQGLARMTVENAGAPPFTLDARGEPVPWSGLPGREPGLLYEGPVAVAGVATVPEFGFRFRAFPFARAKPGYLNLRVYSGDVPHTLRHLPGIWRGHHPVPGMTDFFVTAARMRFSRPMPFQVGGDGEGERARLELGLADEQVEIVDWPLARQLAGNP